MAERERGERRRHVLDGTGQREAVQRVGHDLEAHADGLFHRIDVIAELLHGPVVFLVLAGVERLLDGITVDLGGEFLVGQLGGRSASASG